ncbi:MAG: hypothetical protein ACNA7W_14605 [Pseudomonadales bacterium]
MKPTRGGAGRALWGWASSSPDQRETDVTKPAARDRAGARAAAESRQTLLLPLLFEQVDEQRPLVVLDVGAGVAETVEFFSRFRCRLHFADLFDAPQLSAPPGDDAEAYFAEVFAELCDFGAETRFDICLLWDFPNYLPLPALRAFSAALRPFLHRDTRGHGFGAFKASAPAMAGNTPEVPLQFGIDNTDQLVVRPRSTGLATRYSHSRAVLADVFSCFEIARGTLLRDGAMELLLHTRY